MLNKVLSKMTRDERLVCAGICYGFSMVCLWFSGYHAGHAKGWNEAQKRSEIYFEGVKGGIKLATNTNETKEEEKK